VLVVCTSVSKVRAILKKRLGILFDGTAGFSLKVCRGQVLRSRNRGARALSRRSMKGGGEEEKGEEEERGNEVCAAANPGFQERPLNGASIGAWIGDRHLPPVSFGGLIMVDDRAFGMTVHHMLDDPEMDQPTPSAEKPEWRSMARGGPEVINDLAAWYAQQQQQQHQDDEEDESSGTEDFACEFSDEESDREFSESDITSEASEDEQDEGEGGYYPDSEAGDIPGIEPGCGEEYVVTQPALDDVEEGFYPSPETQDEDHLDTYSLGEVYASSGIRRRTEQGLIHEIDWALFEFEDHREPEENLIPLAAEHDDLVHHHHHPTAVVSTAALPGLEVQCMARTSGLQTGTILPAITSVKIYGRKSPSHTYQISGSAASTNLSAGNDQQDQGKKNSKTRTTPLLPMGVPGDSGAWVVDRRQGRLCGHVLAWSERKRVAYICPMDVLLRDILETLGAGEVRLPGSDKPVVWAGRTPVLDATSVVRASKMGEVKKMGFEGDVTQVEFGGVGGQVHGVADDDGDSYDEGVEVEVDIAEEMGKLRLSAIGLDELGAERTRVS
jgi:hypothetical protein